MLFEVLNRQACWLYIKCKANFLELQYATKNLCLFENEKLPAILMEIIVVRRKKYLRPEHRYYTKSFCR